MKPIFEYVISAPLLGVFPNKIVEKIPHRELIKETMNAYGAILDKSIQAHKKNVDSKVSILYNGFVEENQLRNFNYYGRLKFSNLYADSGGLQMVTRGMEITEALKDKIYEVQSHADFAMCFDVIKLETESVTRTKNERSNISNKTFDGANHKEAGFETGKNVKRQIQYFREHGVNTKVIPIVQGNNLEHMLVFFNEIERQLTDDDYDNIGGFAVADTCMGNGELESVEMLRAAHAISRNCHHNIAQHLHLLGVGSIHRMVPVTYLKQSGYLDNIDYISYDSSTHSQSFAFGAARLDGKTIKLGAYRNDISETHFKNLYNFYREFLSTKITEDEFLGLIFHDGKEPWSIAKINERNLVAGIPWQIAIGYLAKTAHTFYQVDNFVRCIDRLFDPDFSLDKRNSFMLNSLKNVKNEDDIREWLDHQKQSPRIKSKRIRSKEDIQTIGFLYDINN